MKNPQSRSAPRGGFSTSGNSNTDACNVPDATTPIQAGSSDPLVGDGYRKAAQLGLITAVST
jgi:hypothetical protein